jgi:hypothetical protein
MTTSQHAMLAIGLFWFTFTCTWLCIELFKVRIALERLTHIMAYKQ